MVTSFSSKSELALNQSTDSQYVTFMGYVAPSGAVDVSNADTPGAIDTTNTDSATPTYRAIAQLDDNGNFSFTETSAYSGNNGRAAIEDRRDDMIFLAGNGGNGSKPEPEGVVVGTGSQLLAPSTLSGPEPRRHRPRTETSTSPDSATTADTAAKDNNYRGMTIYNNVVYLTKGSGSNGVDTVYFVDTTGAPCPTGAGLPSGRPPCRARAGPPRRTTTATRTLALTTTQPRPDPDQHVRPQRVPGIAGQGATGSSDYPFGIWFANPTTLYVADEGAGDNTYRRHHEHLHRSCCVNYRRAAEVVLQRHRSWALDYILQNGLNLGTPYSVASNPTRDSNACSTGPEQHRRRVTGLRGRLPPANDGLRNLTGQVNSNGTVTIWASTSTVSGAGDQGADPNQLVDDHRQPGRHPLPTTESFTSLAPTYGQVIRGVSFTPITSRPIPARGTLGAPASVRPRPWAAGSSSGTGACASGPRFRAFVREPAEKRRRRWRAAAHVALVSLAVRGSAPVGGLAGWRAGGSARSAGRAGLVRPAGRLGDLAGPDTGGADVQPTGAEPFTRGSDPLDVGVPAPLGATVGVAEVHPERRVLATHFANGSHDADAPQGGG